MKWSADCYSTPDKFVDLIEISTEFVISSFAYAKYITIFFGLIGLLTTCFDFMALEKKS